MCGSPYIGFRPGDGDRGAGAGEGRRGYPEGRRTRRATFVARGQISNARISETVTRSGSCNLLLEPGRRALSIGEAQMLISK